MGRVAPDWLRRNLAFQTVVIASDYDEPGEDFAARLRAMLTSGTRCIRLTLPIERPKEDANDVLRRES